MDKRTKVEIDLEFPVERADHKLEKVTMRRPVMADMIKHQIGLDMTMQDSVNLIADLCGLVSDDIEKMDTCDFEKLQNQLLRFRGVN